MNNIFNVATLAPGEDCEGNVFEYICLSVRARNSKTIAAIDVIFYTIKYYPHGSVLPLILIICIGIRIWTLECINAFFTIAR